MDLKKFDQFKEDAEEVSPILLWNHRWEYDKNPETFFNALFKLKSENIDFKLIVLGEEYKKMPSIFKEAKERLADQILHFGYAESFGVYAKWLWKANILPVTSNQDFFGGSVVEAIYCDCLPLLPNRLAYPEHLSIDFHNALFFDSEESFYQKLKEIIINKTYLKYKKGEINSKVLDYDWQKIIGRYDEQLESVL